jgi:hypothetical protein
MRMDEPVQKVTIRGDFRVKAGSPVASHEGA